MSSDWYTLPEIQRWTEADARGFGEHAEWLTAQLNAAFNKGKQLGDEHLRRALDELNADQHQFQSRPCPTCAFITKVIGKPFGCSERYQEHLTRQLTRVPRGG